MAHVWPDSSSPVLARIDFGVPVADLLEWLKIRDTLLGENEVTQDFVKALRLAHSCKHPDAVWLTSIFKGKDGSTKHSAKAIFLAHEKDSRALCFAWFLQDDRCLDMTLLRRSIELGNAFAAAASSERSWWLSDMESVFNYAQQAGAQHDRDGFYWLGRCFQNGLGCKKDVHRAKDSFLVAASLMLVLQKSIVICWSSRTQRIGNGLEELLLVI